jgi:hypothetical protein
MKRSSKIAAFVMGFLACFLAWAVDSSPVAAGGYCEWAQFVTDISVPDGWPVYPGQVFKKTWRLKNIGTCTWTRSYTLVFAGGEQMGGLSAVNLPKDVRPGETVDVSVDLMAPSVPGLYRGYWHLRNPSGGLFGIGPTATRSIWVEVNVAARSHILYDFAANMCSATWATEWGGKLPCSGVIPDERGVVMRLDRPFLETGSPANAPGILMIPPFEYNESIHGMYPPIQIKYGDVFQSLIGCEYGAKGCEVQFVIKYKLEGDSGYSRTYWNSFEKSDGAFRKVNWSLNNLAGQTVSFILMVRPLGDSLKDRALWVDPVIVRPGEPVPPGPTPVPLPSTPVSAPTAGAAPPAAKCDRASFISDVTVPDGTVFTPGQSFTKTWRLKNSGTCAWNTGYSLVFYSGELMSGPASSALPTPVAPGQTADISVNLIAPANPGSYRGYWMLKNPAGTTFGIGSSGNNAFWLDVRTLATPASTTGYDFATSACQAGWSSGAGVLPCPGNAGSVNGYGLLVNNPVLENNTTDSRPGLLMVPQNIYNGSIQAIYPPFMVQSGDRFQSIVNCELRSTNCYVVFRLDYQINNGPVVNLWSFGERHENLYYQADVDLSSLAGQTVQFILSVASAGSPLDDRALWVGPRIQRAGAAAPTPLITETQTLTYTPIPIETQTPTLAPTLTGLTPSVSPTVVSPTFTVTATVTPVPPSVVSVGPDWTIFQDVSYGYTLRFPPAATLSSVSADRIIFYLPVTPGTNLVGKYLQIDARPLAGSCTNPLGWTASGSSTVTLNGSNFLTESGALVVNDQQTDWRTYSTSRNGYCVSLTSVLNSNPAGAPPFNPQYETAVFDAILSTFGWMTP